MSDNTNPPSHDSASTSIVKVDPKEKRIYSLLDMLKKKKRRIASDVEHRAADCKEFSEKPGTYRSIEDFLSAYRTRAEPGE